MTEPIPICIVAGVCFFALCIYVLLISLRMPSSFSHNETHREEMRKKKLLWEIMQKDLHSEKSL